MACLQSPRVERGFLPAPGRGGCAEVRVYARVAKQRVGTVINPNNPNNPDGIIFLFPNICKTSDSKDWPKMCCYTVHPQKCCHTLKRAVTPSRVLSHPQALPSKLLPNPQKCCHTLKSAVTPSKVLPHPQQGCHTLKTAVTPSKALPHLQTLLSSSKLLRHPHQ